MLNWIRPKFKNEVILITGASSGIGKALAREFAERGASLVLMARRKDRIQELSKELQLKGTRAIALEGDVNQEADLQRVVSSAREVFGKIDVVIANAGFGVAGRLERLTVEDYRRQFETNFFGVLKTIYATLSDLKSSKGRLVIVGSVAGHVGLPESTPYASSKFAVRGLAEGLHFELKSSEIRVTLISPGFVDSEIRKVDNRGVYRPHAKEPIPEWIRVPTVKAAIEIVNAVGRGKREAIITGHGKLIVAFRNYLGPIFYKIIGMGIQGRKEPGR